MQELVEYLRSYLPVADVDDEPVPFGSAARAVQQRRFSHEPTFNYPAPRLDPRLLSTGGRTKCGCRPFTRKKLGAFGWEIR